MLFLPSVSQTVTPSPPAMTRVGVSPRACAPIWVDGWKKWSRSQAVRSLVRSSIVISSGGVDADVFQVGECLDAMARAFATETRLLDAPEGDRGTGDLHTVDRHHAVVERAAKA